MKKKNLTSKAILFSAIALAAVVLVLIVQSLQKPVWQGGYSIHISEVMTSNTTCPNENGTLCDWVEIQNTSKSDFSLDGYGLTDELGKSKYSFPSGTVVPAGGYLVVWCDASLDGDYAGFSLRSEGNETVAILNSNNVAVDSCQTISCEKGQSLVRSSDGTFALSDTPTPGFSNDEAGAQAWAEVLASRSGGELRLSEVMTSNTLYISPDGNYYDWIEVYNPSSLPVSLAGYKLTDREGELRYLFPEDEMLAAGEYLVVWCSTGVQDDYIAPFALKRAGGETLELLAPSNTVCDELTLPALTKNISYALQNGSWQQTEQATPGYPNTAEGYASYVSAGGYGESGLRLNEVICSNKTGLQDSDGDFSDWLELYNEGTEPISLKGWYLSDNEEMLTEWALPDIELAPGAYQLVYLSGKNRSEGELHASFSLSAGETLFITTPAGTPYTKLETTDLADNCSLAYNGTSGYYATAFPTPGEENTPESYIQAAEIDQRDSDILLWKISSTDGDSVTLKNVGNATVDLSGYKLYDSNDISLAYALSGSLASGETLTFDALPFSLGSDGDEVFLWNSNGELLDWASYTRIPDNGSFGRQDNQNGFFYFTKAGEAYRCITATPTVNTAGGMYDNCDGFTIVLSGQGDIHYTTDGSTPDANSALYQEPLEITATTVLRAVCIEENCLTGEALTVSYFLNENSTLPILSMVTDESNLFGGSGIYDMHETAWEEKWEKEASLAMYEEDGSSFEIDCGIRIHGRTSRRVSDKRSFTIKFRGEYGGDLSYDVFGDGEILDFSTLILRTTLGNNYTTYLRDELFAELASSYTCVPSQNYRYVSLYLNGEYWGIYAIREHHDEDYFASHYNVSADSVDMQTGEYRLAGKWDDILTYAENNNLSSTEAWNYIQENVDVDTMIDWLILECWGGDTDVYENVRFYASSEYEEGRYLYAITDMDLTMNSHETYQIGFDLTMLSGIIPVYLRNNKDFQAALLTRMAELLKGGLSTESVNAALDKIVDQLQPEVARDLERWGLDSSVFDTQLESLRLFIEYRSDEMINGFTEFFGLSAEEAAAYFN